MRRRLLSALHLLTTPRHNDLRPPWCQSLHRYAVLPGSRLPRLGREATVETSQALLASAFGGSAVSVPETRHQKHHWVSFFSYQHQHTQQEGPDMSLLYPALQQQWHHARNAHLGNTVIKSYSRLQVWWCCDKCPDGHLHSWSASVQSRSNGSGCPQCRGKKVCKHKSLATRAPKAAAQWDYAANNGTPESVAAQSNQRLSWLCDVCGHKWHSALTSRVSKNNTRGCPVCKSAKKRTRYPTFAECNHPLLAEWDHIRNAAEGYTPANTSVRGGQQVFWLCTKCPAGQEHSWSARPTHRAGHPQTGCPYCAGKAACRCNSLQALYLDIAAEWDQVKNPGQPSNYTASSNYSAWWFNPQRGSWQQTIKSRTTAEKQRTLRNSRRLALQATRNESARDSRGSFTGCDLPCNKG
ncbi:hypothetical protein ABBQ32_002618 [Trebouxia sp. C0010 RCD-2024]